MSATDTIYLGPSKLTREVTPVKEIAPCWEVLNKATTQPNIVALPSPPPPLPVPVAPPFNETNPVFAMVVRTNLVHHKHIRHADTNVPLLKEAYIGDKVLDLAVALLLETHPFMIRSEAACIGDHIKKNAFLSRFLPAASLGYPVGVHSRGTVVEVAIARVYRTEGMESVLKVVEYMYEEAVKAKREMKSPEGYVVEVPAWMPAEAAKKIVKDTVRRLNKEARVSVASVSKVAPTAAPVELPTKALASTLSSPPPVFKESITDSHGHIIGYVSVDGQRIMYGDHYRGFVEGNLVGQSVEPRPIFVPSLKNRDYAEVLI